ncbi:cilia- and flagella-associated protein HOATZ [Patella vulgata]|uniref:cilia- and flagella-associated protein HOATZ n=1 Tax=Patella vulgata TaxID=6465 RepID=UPI00218031D8|nr:cilia- and flagella-associated protein HOATZ [Patella vulgata]
MAVSVVDFTRKSERTTFCDSSEDDISCAKTFWQSVTLLPPMESRLVSSDIKQRLRTAPSSSQHRPSTCSTYRVPDNDLAVQEFLTRAKNMVQMEEFLRLREFASARDEDREMLHKRRKERKKREEISRNRIPKRPNQSEDIIVMDSDEDKGEDTVTALKDLDKFDKLKSNGEEVDSD